MEDELLKTIKDKLLNLDPVAFCERYLTLDNKPFRIHGNGYKPFADIYRYIGIKALEKDSKPVVVLKGRQVGMTTCAAAMELYFLASELFGGEQPIARILHAFPQLDLANAYGKVKLNSMIAGAVSTEPTKKGEKPKSFIQSKIDTSNPSNDSIQFKQFRSGSHLWIESLGLDGQRTRGKQLSLDTDIPTPTGFIKLADLKEDDELFDEQGNICQVTKMHPINLSPESYRITFDDETTVDACADHLWLTYTKQNRTAMLNFINGTSSYIPNIKIKNTKEILSTLKVNTTNESNHSIPNCLPLNYPKKDLPIDPYLFGLWLGDGSSRGGQIETADSEVLNGYEHRICPSSITIVSKSSAYRIIGLTTKLNELRKLGKLTAIPEKRNKYSYIYDKNIPDDYLYASFEQRLALVQGLMDSDASCDKEGRIEFVSVYPALAEGVLQLLLSLGIKAHLIKNKSFLKGKQCKDRYRINFITRLPVFRLQRKLERQKTDNKAIFRTTHRFITNIESIPSVPMRCITVDSPSSLFLITKKFIPTHNTVDILFVDEVQDSPRSAIGNATKILAKAQLGPPGQGVQVYFGTPKQRGSAFFDMWSQSSQQYFHLGCEKCKKHFPLYTPNSNEWETIWLYGFIVRCTHCGHDQDKRNAAERGKWIGTRDLNDCDYVGFHISQLYMPDFTREKIDQEKPGISTINTPRTYANEVLGEFYSGETSIITPDQVRDLCGDPERKFRAAIPSSEETLTFLGVDIGERNEYAQLGDSKQQGQSYSVGVVIALTGPKRISIEYAVRFKRNDLASKKGIIDELMRKYSCNLGVIDLGYTRDLSEILQTEYGEKMLSSVAAGSNVKEKVKYDSDVFPRVIRFDRDYMIAELYNEMKNGSVRFPLGSYEQIIWMIEHVCSMEIVPKLSRSGDTQPHYTKGSAPNDAMMALLNAYLAYKYYVSNGFKLNSTQITGEKKENKPIAAILGHVPRMK